LKTKGRPRPKEKKQSSEYGRVRGAHMSRVRVELGFIRGRGLSSNQSGDDGGTQTGIRSEVKWMSGWETKHRIQNPKCKHDTEGGGATAKLPWKFLELWPADY